MTVREDEKLGQVWKLSGGGNGIFPITQPGGGEESFHVMCLKENSNNLFNEASNYPYPLISLIEILCVHAFFYKKR